MSEVKFTDKQEKAIQCRLSGMIPVEAYRAAYNCSGMTAATTRRRAGELFHKPKILKRVEDERKAMLQRNHTDIDEVLALMAESLRVDPAEIFDQEGNVKSIHEIPVHVRRAMVGFEAEEKDGGLFSKSTLLRKIKFNPKTPIMDMFMKRFGEYINKLEVEHKVPIAQAITPAEAALIDKKLNEEY